MTTVEKIKAKIFDLAIRGKLVPQDPNDEPASELLKRIRAEKEELVKAKKIKKEKNPSEIVIGSDGRPYEKFANGKTVCIEDELPFAIPNTWTLARLQDISGVISKGTTPRGGEKAYAQSGIKFIRAENVSGCIRLSLDSCRYIDATTHKGFLSRSILEAGDLLITIAGTLGRTGIVSKCDLPANTNQAVSFVRLDKNVEGVYVKYCLDSTIVQDMMLGRKKVTGIPNLTLEIIARQLIPLPPLAEQKRIVAKIEKLFAEVEKISAAVNEITRTAERINKKVLDLAIRGQLVPQDPNDEPAEGLLKRIAEARQRNANKKSRKSKCKESVIFYGADRSAYETRNGKTVCIDDEIPFDIPDSWTWARLGAVLLPMESKRPDGEWFEYIDIDAIDNKRNRVITPKKLKVVDAPSRASRGLRTGDTLFSVVRPYLRNIAHINERLANCIASTGFYVCRPSDEIDDQYLFNLLLSDYVVNGLTAFMKGDNSPSVRVEHVYDFLIPLPPLSEQKRIVAKIEEVRKLTQSLTM